jgi:CBS domain-containing protein
MMRVSDLMTTDVRVCGPHDTLSGAAQVLWTGGVGCVPVVDAGRLLGMLTDRDVCGAAYMHCRPLHAIRVTDAMTAAPPACGPDDDVGVALDLMRAQRLPRLPVVDGDGRLVGLLSLTDLAAEAARERAGTQRDLDAADVAETIAAVRRRAA